MNISDDFLNRFFTAVGIPGLLICVLSALVLTIAFEMKIKSAVRVLCLLLTIVCSTAVVFISEASRRTAGGQSSHFYVAFAYRYRVLLIVVLVISAVVNTVLLVAFIRKRRHEVGPDSIKELFDDLPDGISFTDENGLSHLSNAKMINLRKSLFGGAFFDEHAAWEKLENEELPSDCHILKKARGNIVIKYGDEVISFRKRRFDMQPEIFTEYVAVDVTDEYRLNQEVESSNRALADVNKRLHEFNENVVQYAREKENLETKIKVHDDLGRLLILSRAYLELKPDQRDREELLRRWRINISMQGKNRSEDDANELEAFYEAAGQLAVTPVLTGELPGDSEVRRLVFQILRECMNNVVRHADGNVMNVSMEKNGELFRIKITNDGKTPEKEVVPGGGLGNIKKRIELLGGSMKLTSFPEFAFEASIPDIS